MDKILIKGLRISTIVGLLPHEREYEQDLVLDIKISHNLKEAGKTQDLNASVNYAAVADFCKKFVVSRKAELLETLGYELCREIIQRFNVAKVSIKLKKISIVSMTKYVGIKISLKKEDL